MQPYKFALLAGARAEELGAMGMRDDSEAIAFGEQLARDLASAKQRKDSAVAIIQGERTVGSIPLLNCATAKLAGDE
jgi:hypothetical protein